MDPKADTNFETGIRFTSLCYTHRLNTENLKTANLETLSMLTKQKECSWKMWKTLEIEETLVTGNILGSSRETLKQWVCNTGKMALMEEKEH